MKGNVNMINLTYREQGKKRTKTVKTLTYAVIHRTDGIYLYYAPEGVKSMRETFNDTIIKLDLDNHYLSAKTIENKS